uniref:Uncharacterized protein n=1 Tax=Solanum lycopersicum TaxID=4081 RepID=A0A3Q7I518_SOLLC
MVATYILWPSFFKTKIESVSTSQIYELESLRGGYAIFASGIIMVFVNIVCGLCIDIIGSNSVI